MKALLADLPGNQPPEDPGAGDPPAEPVSKRGEVYQLGPHRLMCGDSTSAEDVAALLGGAEPRLMVTDPPYGVELDQGWRDRAGLNVIGGRLAAAQGDKLSGDDRADWAEAYSFFPGDAAYVWHSILSREKRPVRSPRDPTRS